MTYGHWLDAAATALTAAAAEARRGRATQHAQAGAVLAERDRIVHTLSRLVELLPTAPPANGRPHPADPDNHLPDHATLLLRALQHAPTGVARQPHPDSTTTLLHQITAAAHSLDIAADILASHTDPTNGPRTPDGAAISHGVGRAEALAELATLTTTMATMDRHLLSWLDGNHRTPPAPAAGHHTAIDTIRAWLAGPDRLAVTVVAATAQHPSVLRPLTVAAPDPPPGTIRTPTTTADAADVLRDLALWLYRHPDQVETHHLTAATRAGLLIAAPAWRHTATGWQFAAMVGWRKASLAFTRVAAPPPPTPDPHLIELDHLADHLNSHVPHSPGHAPLAQQLPILAFALDTATERAVRRGIVFVKHAALQPTPTRAGVHHATVSWIRATPYNPTIVEILSGLRQATTSPPDTRHSLGRAFPPPRSIDQPTATPPPHSTPHTTPQPPRRGRS